MRNRQADSRLFPFSDYIFPVSNKTSTSVGFVSHSRSKLASKDTTSHFCFNLNNLYSLFPTKRKMFWSRAYYRPKMHLIKFFWLSILVASMNKTNH